MENDAFFFFFSLSAKAADDVSFKVRLEILASETLVPWWGI